MSVTDQPGVEVDTNLVDEIVHEIENQGDVLLTWDYERTRAGLSKLYEKAKTSQWNGATDLDWSIEVDWDQLADEAEQINARFNLLGTHPDSPLAAWKEKEWRAFRQEMQTYFLSQFLHGEQGALVCTGLITSTVPWIDAKYYASTQVMDEARHVEVFARYLDEKTEGAYPINPNLRSLLDDIISDGRWDITYLGMQIMVEGLALAAFGFLHAITNEPLLKKLLRYVMSDEARHVAFGVLSLQEFYQGLSAKEIRERQEFAYEAAVALQRRMQGREVFERMGADPDKVYEFVAAHDDPGDAIFQSMLFAKIVPNCKKLGLLDAADGWLRQKFVELEIIQFEDWVDTSNEYESLDALASAHS